MKKHCITRIAAGLLAAGMLLPTAVNLTQPLCASANELLGETTFDYKMIPWMPIENSPAKQDFKIDEGTAHMIIITAKGRDHASWDLQFRHKNIDFREGHTYSVSFKAKSNRYGLELCSFIGERNGETQYFVLDGTNNEMIMGPEMEGKWGTPLKLTTSFTEIKGTFTPTRDIEAAEWTFWYAYDSDGRGGNAQDGDEIWFDDMSITEQGNPESDPPIRNYGYAGRGYSGLENNYISVNQLGYIPGFVKTATLSDNGGDLLNGAEKIKLKGTYRYEIVNVSDDSVAYTGTTGKVQHDADSNDEICKIDFTAFDQPGEYYLRIKDTEWRSFPFRINTDIYHNSAHNLLTNALNSFYQNRAGTDISAKYITSGRKNMLEHAADRDESVGIVQSEWVSVPMNTADDANLYSSSRIDVSGGWYTGEFYEKYMTESGIAVWTLQNLYERSIGKRGGIAKFADGSGTVVIPETDNGIPDILDECRYELDFMSKMKVSPDEKTWSDYAGMYYHMLRGAGFSPDKPDYEHEYHAAFAVMPPTFAATLNYAACAAQGARLWAEYDAEYAAELLESAKAAYQAYKANWYKATHKDEYDPKSLYASRYYVDDEDFNVENEAYWAACELYISAKEMNDSDAENYLTELSAFGSAFEINEHADRSGVRYMDNSYTVFTQDDPSAAGSLSLLLHKQLLTDEQTEKLTESLLKTADDYLRTEAEQGYSLPYKYDPEYAEMSGLDYTPYEGFEYDSNGMTVNNMIAMAYAYDLTQNTKYLDGVAAGMDYLLGNNPLSISFITGYGSYQAKNPAHRFWKHDQDSSLPFAPDGILVSGPNACQPDRYIRALGFVPGKSKTATERCYSDSSESWSTNAALLSDNASLAWVVSFIQDATVVPDVSQLVTGDANGNGKADAADVRMLLNYLLGKGRITSPAAADLNQDGKLTAADLSLLKRRLLKNSSPALQ